MRYKKIIFATVLLLTHLSIARAQIALPPYHNGINSYMQENSEYCWAAACQMVIEHLTGNLYSQCFLVEQAYPSIPAGDCCGGNVPCDFTGNLQQIQYLIGRFGGHAAVVVPPTNPMVLYQTICSGRIIMVQLQTTPFVGHVIVIEGMEWDPVLGPILFVNDPESFFTQPITFQNLVNMYWRSAIVVN